MRRPQIALLVIVMLITLVMAGYGVWFWQNFERQEQTNYAPPAAETGEARHRYRLAMALLQERGMSINPVANLTDLPTMPAATDVVLLFAPLHTSPSNRTLALLAWVETGGHLIVLGSGDRDDENADQHPILQHFAVSFFSGPNPDHPVQAVWFDEVAALGVDFSAYSHISTIDPDQPPDWQAGPDDAAHLLQYKHGTGLVTILADIEVFTDLRLAEYDHAEALWRLVRLGRDPALTGTVWLQYAVNVPSLGQLIWQHASAIVLLSALLLLLWLWHVGWRFGPRLQHAEGTRRALLEHIRAAALWSWNKQPQSLWLATRRRTLKLLERRYPDLSGMPPEQRQQRLAERLGIEVTSVAEALSEKPPANQTDAFTLRIKMLQSLLETQAPERGIDDD